ncbi:MAG: QueG-associated DUF1730 domain-containing protein [Candidatus Margulisiibacteriota bacterium]|jgi:epoxyqueuosine reductase
MLINKEEEIKSFVLDELRFDDVGFTNPFINKCYFQDYYDLIENNRFGKLNYLKKHLQYKENPDLLLANVKSAIVVIKSYNKPRGLSNFQRIARYATGEDYHKVINKKLEQLAGYLEKKYQTNSYWGVDSKPIPERSLALSAGLGFLGKNRIIINEILGSFFFIGVLYSTLELENKNQAAKKSKCGTCDLCVKQCPTQAILKKDKDSTQLLIEKCISYQTIYQQPILGWIKGCDICQEVCPYNKNKPVTNWQEFLD